MPSPNGTPWDPTAAPPGPSAMEARRGGAHPHPSAGPVRPELDGLRRMYERYCDHEARALLGLVPREGLRAMHARARAALSTTAEGASDPMALLVRYARHILPLPPYERWLETYLRDRRPFLEALGIATVPERAEPVLVDVRPLGGGWIVELHLLRTGGEWRGFLCYSCDDPSDEDGPYRTSDIFRGADPEDFLVRFRGFHAATLEAFLRSVRP